MLASRIYSPRVGRNGIQSLCSTKLSVDFVASFLHNEKKINRKHSLEVFGKGELFGLIELPGGSNGKKSVCNAEDVGLIPGLG